MQAISDTNIINVTTLPPGKKHPIIFEHFDVLGGGESLTIYNDHDPKPLYYQLLGLKGNVFNWEYLEEGPDWWKVRITKRGQGEKDETLGQIAAKDLRKAEVFKKYGLDFCCGGHKTVKEVCAEKGLDAAKIEKELQTADKNPAARPLPYNDWNLDFLSDYIVNTHHSYVRKALPQIREYAAKVYQVHGAGHPELEAIHQHVEEIGVEMIAHMEKEERVLFPHIKALVAGAKGGTTNLSGTPDLMREAIHMMELEHETVGSALAEIRRLTNDYVLPGDACASYTLLFSMLEEFENDLHLHVHLENNILFPKALEMEKKKIS